MMNDCCAVAPEDLAGSISSMSSILDASRAPIAAAVPASTHAASKMTDDDDHVAAMDAMKKDTIPTPKTPADKESWMAAASTAHDFVHDVLLAHELQEAKDAQVVEELVDRLIHMDVACKMEQGKSSSLQDTPNPLPFSLKLDPCRPTLSLNRKTLSRDLKLQNELFMERIKSFFCASAVQGSVDTNAVMDRSILKSQFQPVFELCGLAQYLQSSFWRYLTEDWVDDGISGRGWRLVQSKRLTLDRFKSKWNALIECFGEDEYAFVYEILRGGRPMLKTLSAESFELICEDVVMNHADLSFLQGNALFQRRYIETVITRLFYSVARTIPPLEEDVVCRRAKGMSMVEFRNSRFIELLKALGHGEINDERCFFSYKHFFVIYCKYFDLDTKNSMRIDGTQLVNYERGVINRIVCDRVSNGSGLTPPWRAAENMQYRLRPYHYGAAAMRRGMDSAIDLSTAGDEEQDDVSPRKVGELTYTDFLWFILSEEDRTSPTAIEYWFRVLDLDDDGVISLYELEMLWEYQEYKLGQEGFTAFDFRDIICVALDLTKTQPSPHMFSAARSFPVPSQDGPYAHADLPMNSATDPIVPLESPIFIRLCDLKKMPALTARFLDFFINFQKMLEREGNNGNRLGREIDEAQQMYFQQQQFLALSHSENDLGLSKVIPTDNKTSFARWADGEYDQYILQEELEQQRQRLQQHEHLNRHVSDIYASVHREETWQQRSSVAIKEEGEDNVASIKKTRSQTRWRRGRVKLRRSWLARNADGKREERPENDEGIGADFEDYEDFEDDDMDTSSDEEMGLAEKFMTSSSKGSGLFADLSDEELVQFNEALERFTADTVIVPDDDRPVARACWTETSPAPAALETPANLKMEPLGTVAQEHPAHASRLQQHSPPRSPNSTFGGRKVMQNNTTLSTDLDVEDID